MRRFGPACSVACLAALGACATTPGGASSVARHLDPGIWGDALLEQVRNPARLWPAVGLAGAGAYAFRRDDYLLRKAREGHVTGGDTALGDGTLVGLTALAGGLAAGNWLGGDGGRSAEVLVESLLLVEGTTELLKRATGRHRPNGTGHDAFPSGHAAASFMLATFVARGVGGLGDEWYHGLGYLAYLPAAYVGVNRCEANRHHPTDVVVGALLGVVLTNLVYDAHYGAPGRPGIFGERAVAGWSVEPEVLDAGGGLAMVLRF
ncbi:MAG: phosphatase PAP2 family protein [Planctomycetes bacterium]|nr:phosphatase PAP2 family protein [Planctomycetota bacterium]